MTNRLRNCLFLVTFALLELVSIAYHQQEQRTVPKLAHSNLAKRLEKQEAHLRTEIRALHKHLRKKKKGKHLTLNETQKPALSGWNRFVDDMKRLDERVEKMRNN